MKGFIFCAVCCLAITTVNAIHPKLRQQTAMVETETGVKAIYADPSYVPGPGLGGHFGVSYDSVTKVLDVEVKTDLYFMSTPATPELATPQWSQKSATKWASAFKAAVKKAWNGIAKIRCTPAGAAPYNIKINTAVTPRVRVINNNFQPTDWVEATNVVNDPPAARHYRLLVTPPKDLIPQNQGLLRGMSKIKNNPASASKIDYWGNLHQQDIKTQTGAEIVLMNDGGLSSALAYLKHQIGFAAVAGVYTFDDLVVAGVGKAATYTSAKFSTFAGHVTYARGLGAEACLPAIERLPITVTANTKPIAAYFVSEFKRLGFKKVKAVVNTNLNAAHFTVQTVDNNAQNAKTLNFLGQVTAAHEFGHMLGNPDFYNLPIAAFDAKLGWVAGADAQRDHLYAFRDHSGPNGVNGTPKQSKWLKLAQGYGLTIPVFGATNECFMSAGSVGTVSQFAVVFKAFKDTVGAGFDTSVCRLVHA